MKGVAVKLSYSTRVLKRNGMLKIFSIRWVETPVCLAFETFCLIFLVALFSCTNTVNLLVIN